MTEYTELSTVSLARRFADWIGTKQQTISKRVHASGDAYAITQGWTVTSSTGSFGFGIRTYRDPRFDSHAQAMAARTAQQPVRT